jgi:hypothetical protein
MCPSKISISKIQLIILLTYQHLPFILSSHICNLLQNYMKNRKEAGNHATDVTGISGKQNFIFR